MTFLPDIKLSKPYKRNILLLFICLFTFIGFKWLIAPVLENQKALKHKIVQKEVALREMRLLAQQYSQISGTSSFKDKMPGFDTKVSLFAFIDNKAQESGIKENVVYMKPSKKKSGSGQVLDIVDIKLSSVYLSNLIQFLSYIESDSFGVRVLSFSLTRTKSKKGLSMLDVLMETGLPASVKVK